MLRHCAQLLTCAVLVVAFAAEALSYNPRITRSVNRSDSVYHQQGYNVLRPKVLRGIGGVLSQSSRLIDENSRAIDIKINLESDRAYNGYIYLYLNGDRSKYKISYEDLVPLVLFADSGGTSLYTLWDSGMLPDDFQQDAGFLKHDGKGYIALELGGTKFADALEYADLCGDCQNENNSELARNVNKKISNIINLADDDASSLHNSSYINTDLEVPTFAITHGDFTKIESSIIRYVWEIEPKFDFKKGTITEKVSITSAYPFYSIDEFEKRMNSKVEFLLRNAKSAKNSEDKEGWEALANEHRVANSEPIEMHKNALFLFETLALFRSAKQQDAVHWAAFVEKISSQKLVDANPQPWKLYDKSFCSVYADDPGCAN